MERTKSRRQSRINYSQLANEKKKKVLGFYFHKMLKEFANAKGYKQSFVEAASHHSKNLKKKGILSLLSFQARAKRVTLMIEFLFIEICE